MINYEIFHLALDQCIQNSQQLLKLINSSDLLCWDEDNLFRDLPEKWSLSIAISQNMEIIATSINSRKNDSCYIHAFMVDKRFRKKRLGAKLMGIVEEVATRNGLKSLKLRVSKFNISAIKFYSDRGFATYDIDSNFNEILLEKSLSASKN